jgi:hypothetical protein
MDIFCEDMATLIEVVSGLVKQGLTFQAYEYNGGWRVHLTGGY